MYAIIESRGASAAVSGDTIYVDLLQEGNAAAGSKVTFDRVLLVGEPGGSAKLGRPYVAGASVTAEGVEPLVKGDKLVIWKHRPKKTFRKKQGHRQPYTSVRITSING